jgi:ribonucleotide reductase alpha subunit
MWNCEKPTMWNWDELKKRVKKGMRNSLLTTIMPTASTSQILGNYECIEPPQSNIFLRRTLAGQFTIMNKYLVDDLEKLGLWNEDMKDKIIYNNGSIQDINEIPENIKNLYKTVWELSQRFLIDLSIDRGRFIDQSQSLNLFIDKPDFSRLYNCHMHGWKNGLKTGMYYLRTKPAVNAIKYSLGNKFIKQEVKEDEECLVCSS